MVRWYGRETLIEEGTTEGRRDREQLPTSVVATICYIANCAMYIHPSLHPTNKGLIRMRFCYDTGFYEIENTTTKTGLMRVQPRNIRSINIALWRQYGIAKNLPACCLDPRYECRALVLG